jgi:hypothetical protein
MIGVVIPTLNTEQGENMARVAKSTAGCEARFVVVTDREHEGFTRTANRGMRALGLMETCLLNDDVQTFRQGWLADLHSRLVHSPDIGLIGPGPGRGFWFRTPEAWPQYTYSAEHLSFWCVLISQGLRRQAGLLDESYIHYSSDYAYCDLARELGWEVALCSDMEFRHRMGGSKAPTGWKGHDLALYDLRQERGQSPLTKNPYFPKWDMEAFDLLLESLKPKRVLEWGAGHSTVYWPPRIPNLECWVSIEHNFVYWNRFCTEVGESVDLRWLMDDAYLLPDEEPTYDLIIVDGIRRGECLLRAHGLIKPGGAVVLHDWGRNESREGIATYTKQQILTHGGRLDRNGDVTQGLLLLEDAQTESGPRP